MIAANIISGILQRYKQICAKYPQSPSFIPNTKGDSFYLVRKREGNRPVQVRISNHGTYLSKWCDREELGNSVERLDPALCENISIAFIDDGNDITKDCKGRQDCEDCNIQPCIPQTFDGQNELGKPFKVIQYTYKSSQISPRYINGLTKAIAEASVSGKYNDPLANLVKAAKKKPLSSSENNQEIKENRDMNKKQKIRINENRLRQIVTESVKILLKEYNDSNSDGAISYKVSDKLTDKLNNNSIRHHLPQKDSPSYNDDEKTKDVRDKNLRYNEWDGKSNHGQPAIVPLLKTIDKAKEEIYNQFWNETNFYIMGHENEDEIYDVYYSIYQALNDGFMKLRNLDKRVGTKVPDYKGF